MDKDDSSNVRPKKTSDMIVNPALATYILLDDISRGIIKTNNLLKELKGQIHDTKLEKIKIDDNKHIEGEVDRNRYDISDTITTAMAEDPDSPDSLDYNRERIFEVLERNANKLQVLNDGDDSLYVRISHSGSTNFSHEATIRAGETKIYDNVYELRLRSPTVDLPYRVTEYLIDSIVPEPVNIRPLVCETDSVNICDDPARLLGIINSITNPVDVSDRATRLLGVVYGSEAIPFEQDSITHSLVSIRTVHHQIHEGESFSSNDVTTNVQMAAPKRYLLITPDTDTRAHFVFRIGTEPGAKIELFEDTTVSNNGSVLPIFNNNRNSANANELLIYEDPTVTGDGTCIFVEQDGTTTAGGKIGADISHDDEIILKQNTIYQIKITVLANGTDVSTHMDWYEEP